MDQVIQGLETFTAAYLDDLMVYSETFEKHLLYQRQVMETLQAAGFTAKLKTCQFAMTLGHVVGGGGVGLEPSKVEAILIPTNEKKCKAIPWNDRLL